MTAAATIDAPFAVPPVIVLDLPAPPSVNRTRKIDWAHAAKHKEWVRCADQTLLAARALKGRPKIPGPYELLIILSEDHTRIDADNGLKAIIDYLRRIEVVVDDKQSLLRKLTVEWGDAPAGCRVHVRGLA